MKPTQTVRWCAMSAVLAAALLQSACAPLLIGGAAVTAVAIAEDRRTTGTLVDDEGIENRATMKAKTRYGSAIHLNVTSYNRYVLLSGEVPDEATRVGVEQEVRSTGNIVKIYNELVVAPTAGMMAISNDARLTTLVKTRFLEANRFQINHVKVVTEGGTVFLLGIVKRAEADAATQLASTTSGVRRVVRLFEYLD